MRVGDSRALDGPGLVPAQDHRSGLDTDVRLGQVCIRILRRDADGTLRHDEELAGDRRGVAPWGVVQGRRPTPAWRECWPTVIVSASGRAGGVPTAPGGRTFTPPAITPGSGYSGGFGANGIAGDVGDNGVFVASGGLYRRGFPGTGGGTPPIGGLNA